MGRNFPEKKDWPALGRKETGQRDLRGKGPLPPWGSWEIGIHPGLPDSSRVSAFQVPKGSCGPKVAAISVEPVVIIVIHSAGPA